MDLACQIIVSSSAEDKAGLELPGLPWTTPQKIPLQITLWEIFNHSNKSQLNSSIIVFVFFQTNTNF